MDRNFNKLSRALPVSVIGNSRDGKNGIQFKYNRPQSVLQRKQVDAMAGKPASGQVIQQKTNQTGLPDQLKSGVESLSGISMDDVKVHYNSSQPAQLNAHAYAQGTDIHIGPGQEKHLPHESWHVVQQKQGRVKPTMQMKGKVNVNDDKGLEKEADVMGNRAVQLRGRQRIIRSVSPVTSKKRVAQMNWFTRAIRGTTGAVRGTVGAVRGVATALYNHPTETIVGAVQGTVGAVSGAVTGTANALYTNPSVKGVVRGLAHGAAEVYQRPGAAVMGLVEGTIRTTGAIAVGVSVAIGTRTLAGAR